MATSFNEVDIRQRIAYEREQGISFREICDHLNRDGILTKTGRPWKLFNLHYYQQPGRNRRAKNMPQPKTRKAIPEKKEPTPTTPKRAPVSIRNVCDVKRVLASTINELRGETMNPVFAGKIIYACTVLLTCFEQSDMANQILELERKAGL